ncbi:MAG: FAD-dependent oxidoreductase, partial [Muribaculaceae bacterium]|nr:FAD-dependent oxidoreductase [Muribaculaceae bacterium]
VDVLVIGGGPSGICAAVGAAKTGVSTMIVEAMGSFGGMWTNGLVITLGGFNSWLKPYRRCVAGVMDEWVTMAEEKGGFENNRSWVLSSDPEIMNLTADRLLEKYNVKCLLHTWVADTIVENEEVKGVIIENVDGRSAIMAKIVVDCTGNGDVMARAGAEYRISDELQPMTLPFFLADVDPSGEIAYEDELLIPIGPEPGYLGKEGLDYSSRRRDIGINVNDPLLSKAYEDGELPFFGGPWFGGLRLNYPWVNTTRVYGSAVNARELTDAEIEARRDAHTIADYYRSHCKGFNRSWIMTTAATIGIRETRRLVGEYTMTRDDIVERNNVNDSIALGVWPIDIHPPKGQNGAHNMYVPLPYPISYRSLVPVKIDNLLVAGRCISTEREALGTIRVGATCGAIGHAAGVAAAIAAIKGIKPRNVDINELQGELKNQNAIVE